MWILVGNAGIYHRNNKLRHSSHNFVFVRNVINIIAFIWREVGMFQVCYNPERQGATLGVGPYFFVLFIS